MPSKQTTFPSAPQAALLLLAGFVLRYVLGLALYDFRHALGISNEQLVAFDILLADGILITAVMHMRGMGYRELLHPSKAAWAPTLLLLVPPVLLLIPLVVLLDVSLISFIETLLPISAWEQRAFTDMTAPSLSTIVATCLIAPVVEEMLFRGILLRSFLQGYPRGLAIGYSALYFGAAHLNIYQFCLGFFLGLLLGWLYDKSRSLIPCIAMHAALNSTIFVWSSSMAPNESLTPFDIPMLGWLAALFAAMIGTMALRRLLASRTGGTASEAGSP